MALDLRARSSARAADLPARSFDLARRGVAPPLTKTRLLSSKIEKFSGRGHTLPTPYPFGARPPNLQQKSPPLTNFTNMPRVGQLFIDSRISLNTKE